MSLSMPTTYSGRYEIRHPIGEGAFSRTFLARDSVLQRDVALKVLRREHQGNDEFSARFDREAQAAALVSHPNVVPVFDFGREQNLPYIVMQYIDGRTLREFDRDEGPLTIEEVVGVGRQVLEGLAAIHDQGIVHRDIKPQNVLLDQRMVARLTDFGVAFLANDVTLTETGTTIGTAAYMAPEQATGQSVGPEADLYSVGVMLYELLTRRLPFRGENPVQVLYRHVSDIPDRPRDLDSQIPIELEAVVLRSLAKVPADRYPDARSMRDALTRQRGSLPPVDLPDTVRPAPRRFATPEPATTPVLSPSAPTRRTRTATTGNPPRRIRRSRLLPVLFAIVLLAMAAVVFAMQGLGGNGDNGNPSGAAPTATEAQVPAAAIAETATESPTNTGDVEETPLPTATDEPPEPTFTPEPEPTATDPPDTGGSAPSVSFNTPFPASSLPSDWAQGNLASFSRDDFAGGGAYRREDGVLYDRPAAHLYARNTDYSITTVNFEVSGQPELPDSYIGIVITGMDDERAAKVPFRISLNGEAVWEGESPFENEVWTPIGWRAGNLDLLRPGRNQLTIEVLVDEGEFGLPPWILLTEAAVYWD